MSLGNENKTKDIVGIALLTAPEVAEWLRLRPATIYAWAASGRIPSLKIESRVRFLRDDVLTWLEARKEG